MMKILAMDTSNNTLSVAIVANGQLIVEITTNIAKNHSVRLMPAVDQVMKESGLKPENLDRIAVSKGPGSYTGVRIGLAAAKSMAWALNIPVVGVSSLEVTAWQGRFFQGDIVPFFDARRGLVFTGAYRWKDKRLTLAHEEKNMVMNDWLNELKRRDGQLLFLSPDIETFRSLIVNTLAQKAVIPEGPFHVAKASHLALLAMNRQPDDVHILTPNYLRMAEAEAKWQAAQKDSDNHE